MQRFTPQYPRSYKTKPPSQKAPDRRPLLVPQWERAEMASIYKHRKGWQACANVLGERVKKNFATKAAVKKWANATEVGWGKSSTQLGLVLSK